VLAGRWQCVLGQAAKNSTLEASFEFQPANVSC